MFSERLSDQLLQLLKKWLEAALVGSKTQQPVPQAGGNKGAGAGGHVGGMGGGQPQLKVAASIVKLFTKIPPPSEPAKVILPLSKLILTTEKTLLIEPGSILRAPLKAYLRKFPSEAVDFFLTADSANDAHAARFLFFILDDKDLAEDGGEQVFRAAMKNKTERLIQLLQIPLPPLEMAIQQRQQQQQQQQQQQHHQVSDHYLNLTSATKLKNQVLWT